MCEPFSETQLQSVCYFAGTTDQCTLRAQYNSITCATSCWVSQALRSWNTPTHFPKCLKNGCIQIWFFEIQSLGIRGALPLGNNEMNIFLRRPSLSNMKSLFCMKEMWGSRYYEAASDDSLYEWWHITLYTKYRYIPTCRWNTLNGISFERGYNKETIYLSFNILCNIGLYRSAYISQYLYLIRKISSLLCMGIYLQIWKNVEILHSHCPSIIALICQKITINIEFWHETQIKTYGAFDVGICEVGRRCAEINKNKNRFR